MQVIPFLVQILVYTAVILILVTIFTYIRQSVFLNKGLRNKSKNSVDKKEMLEETKDVAAESKSETVAEEYYKPTVDISKVTLTQEGTKTVYETEKYPAPKREKKSSSKRRFKSSRMMVYKRGDINKYGITTPEYFYG